MGIITGLTTFDSYDNTTAITDNAIDIFIYDTSKDSDGGAWRKRTQHTSWYNEASSSTRGSRNEFPAVAVIVATTTTVTIYDGDTPDLDMWMKFTWSGTGNSALGYDNRPKSAIAMKNGQMVTCAGGGDGVHIARFVHDDVIRYTHTGYYRTTSAIQQRIGFPYATISLSTQLINSTCNDIAIIVMPNAPIDSSTGLPIPTVAVANDGGVNVIKDNGNMSAFTNSYSVIRLLFSKVNNNISMITRSSNVIVTKSITASSSWTSETSGEFTHWNAANSSNPTIGWNPGAEEFVMNNKGEHIMGPVGVNIYSRLGSDSAFDFNRALITHDYNTGYMVGDCKGAWLCDTESANLGSELATNPDFTSNTSGWGGDSGATLTWVSGGTVTVGDGGGDNTWAIKQTSILTYGKQYAIKFKFRPNNTGLMRIRAGGSSVQWSTTSFSVNNWNEVEVVVQADGSTLEIGNSGGNMTSFDIDYINVSLADKDRSITNKGLAVHGTITKAAVETGAELMGYSGFNSTSGYASNGNRLEQPYNSDYDFTGDWDISLWVKSSGTSGSVEIWWADAAGGNGWMIYHNGSTSYFLDGNWSDYTSYLQTNSTSSLRGKWTKINYVKRSGTLEYYLNGKLVTTGTATKNISSWTLTNTSAHKLAFYADTNSTATKFALFKISETATSVQDIKDIYEAEKYLFQVNAKCTLDGSSSYTNAFAYDDETELLHVGTSGGRSVFQGLVRVDETTNNTAYIAAQGGMVVEKY